MSKTDCQLLRQKVRLRISVIPENWHFNSRSVLKTTLLRFIDIINDDPFFNVVKDSSFCLQFY